MKRILTCCALGLSALTLFGGPRDAAACSRCDPNAPRCQTANYSRCATYQYSKTVIVCEQEYYACAWVYAPAEVSADGSLATLAAEVSPSESAEQVRGCHGLVVERSYSAPRQAQARAGSREIVL
jgi:hypothetical protein